MYRGDYNWKEILSVFSEDPSKIEEPEELIFANYDGGGYDGYANVLFYDSGKFWYVTASHCSCYGLEDSWSPEEYSFKALRGQVDHKALILDACDRLEGDLSQLAAAVSRNKRRQTEIQLKLSQLDEEHTALTSEYDKLDAQITDDKKKMKKSPVA